MLAHRLSNGRKLSTNMGSMIYLLTIQYLQCNTYSTCKKSSTIIFKKGGGIKIKGKTRRDRIRTGFQKVENYT